jgi:hypothetical protein
MMQMYWFDDEWPHLVHEVSLMEWSKKFSDSDDRVLAKTIIGKIEISTVFLGMGENWETMLFGTDERLSAGEYQWQYLQYPEAAAHHVEIVKHLMTGGHPDDTPEP